jgi:hypothetical protein
MRRSMLLATFAVLCALSVPARADAPCQDVKSARALDQAIYMLKLAEVLDASAAAQEAQADPQDKSAIAKALEAKRLRDATRGRPDAEASAANARAEKLEAEAAAARALVAELRRDAADSRKRARELREEAVRLAKAMASVPAISAVKETPPDCDPPYSWGVDGRKHYKMACF